MFGVIGSASYDMFQQLLLDRWKVKPEYPHIIPLFHKHHFCLKRPRPSYKVGSNFLMGCVVLEHDVIMYIPSCFHTDTFIYMFYITTAIPNNIMWM